MRPTRNVLVRSRLMRLLKKSADFPLTLLQAAPGYGKSTTLAIHLDDTPTAWLALEREDATPQRFLSYVAHSFATQAPAIAERTLALLEQPVTDATTALDALLNGVTAHGNRIRLVIDDAQHLQQSAPTRDLLDRLIAHAPENLTLLLASRTPLRSARCREWELRGRLLTIGQRELAFSSEEISALFAEQFNRPISAAEASRLVERTQGWPIVLPLIHQRLQQGATLDEAVSVAGSNLFDFLTHQLLDGFTIETRHFLRATAVLRTLDADLCDFVRGAADSARFLSRLRETGLFVTSIDDQRVRYHPLFRDLLRQQLAPTEGLIAHERAARCLIERDDLEGGIAHFVAAGASQQVAKILAKQGRTLINTGRMERVANWIATLPPNLLTAYPSLLLQLGDIARLRSQFESALGWYEQAEAIYRVQNNRLGLGRALRGQARIYLDTIRPARADELLRAALSLSDGEADRASQARLLDLMAENLLNQGQVEQARDYQNQARQLRDEGPSSADLPVRLMLRTGQLQQARAILEERADSERTQPVLHPRAHRETLLLLALIAAMQGDAATAMRSASEGTERGRRFDSPFVTSVGYMRQGAAWLLQKDAAGYAAAQRCFEQAIEVSRELGLPRLRVEAIWGLTQVHGFQGRLEAAAESADRGITIARGDGDEWIAACIEAALGASYVLADRHQDARQTLSRALRHAVECGDTHLTAIAYLWSCLLWNSQSDTIRLERDITALLTLVDAHGYDFLFLRPTLLGPPDPRTLVPLLIFARDRDIKRPVAERLLTQLGLAQIERHPGYQLVVESFGRFSVARGSEEIKWGRQSARVLFQLLLTERGRLLHREQIMETLWPDATTDEAARHFKTAYASLCKELEPKRQRNAPTVYIERRGSRYGVRESADIQFDAARFDALLLEADRTRTADTYRAALTLYRGEYLADAPYAEWANTERQRLANRYLRGCERLAGIELETADYTSLIDIANKMLAVDSCWEPAYRHLMTAHARLGNQAEALRTYERCVDALSADLNLAPSGVTEALRAELLRPA